MKKTIYLIALLGLLISCAKKNNSNSTIVGNVKQTTETRNGITYKSFVSATCACDL